jgi:hypothetical protein
MFMVTNVMDYLPYVIIRDSLFHNILIPHPIHALDHGFEPWSGQTKGCQIGIFCFSTKHSKMRMIFLTISWQEQVTF